MKQHKNATQDYATVIDAEHYTGGLAEHPDIPQSDAGIIRAVTTAFDHSRTKEFRVLDLGCGPGRLTRPLADALVSTAKGKEKRVRIVGLDSSRGFIEIARRNSEGNALCYENIDFLHYKPHGQFNVIVMQGVFHHIPRTERMLWLQKCHTLLQKNGLLIIGDEFIPPYSSAAERVLRVAGLYSYVIGYALENGHTSLATIESMNMVDDVCAGLIGVGHSDQKLLKYIQRASREAYSSVYTQGTRSAFFLALLKQLVCHVQQGAGALALTDTHNHNRGDYKISISEQTREARRAGYVVESRHIYGPVHWLGGMGVLVFRKS